MVDWRALLLVGGFAIAPIGLQIACEPSSGAADTTASTVVSVGSGTFDAGMGGNGEGAGDAGTVVGAGGGEPVYLGLTANALQNGDGPPSAADELLAQLTAQAAGVRLVLIDVAWDTFDADSLGVRIGGYADQELRVAVNLLVVDGHADRRPDDIAELDWDDAEVVAAIQTTIDSVFVAAGESLDALVIARRADAYLDDDASEAAGFASFASAAVGYAQSMGSADLDVGVGVTFMEEPAYQALVQLGSIAAFAYFPGLGQASVPSSIAAAKDLDTMVEQAGDRAIMIQQFGFASAPALGSSVELQQQVFADFFAALAPRRLSFPFVNVHQLHDLSALACDNFAAAQGLEASSVEAQYHCVAGVRDHSGTPKAAWYPFLQAAATFATP